MKFKLAKLSQAQINQLPDDIKTEVIFVKDNTNNFDDSFHDAFGENDKDLYELAKLFIKPAKKETIAQEKPKPKPAPKEVKPAKATKEVEPVKAAKEVEPAKATSATKAAVKPVIKPPKAEQAPKVAAPKPAPAYDYSWRRKVDESLLNEASTVQMNCDFYVIEAEKDMKVDIKHTFKKGEKLLVHKDGYPFAVMQADFFKKRCVKVAKAPAPAPIKPAKPVDVVKAFKDKAPVPLLTWLDGQIELWKNRQFNQKITKLFIIKETGDLVVKFTHYDRLLRVADLRYSYHIVHPETTQLTEVPAPARGSYRLLVPDEKLKEQYATNHNWQICRLWIKEAYACSRDGNCSSSQKDLYSKYYHQCGDQVAKAADIEYLKWRHQRAGEIWKRGKESYFEAFGRVKG